MLNIRFINSKNVVCIGCSTLLSTPLSAVLSKVVVILLHRIPKTWDARNKFRNSLRNRFLLFCPLVAPTLEHRASVKRFVSFQFLNPKKVYRTPWTGDQPVARPLPTYDNINTELTQTRIHNLSRIQTHNPSVQAGDDTSCLGFRVH
jgi:hypothetical protein